MSAAARWDCPAERRALQFRVRPSPTGRRFLLSMASGSGAGAAASANLNAVRETMDGECASRSFYPVCASRRRAPGWRRRGGPRGPRVDLSGVLRGDGEGTRRDLEAGGPRAPVFRSLRRSWARAGRSGLASAACAPSLGPRDLPGVWRLLVGTGEACDRSSGRKGSWTFGHRSVPGPWRFSKELFVSSV